MNNIAQDFSSLLAFDAQKDHKRDIWTSDVRATSLGPNRQYYYLNEDQGYDPTRMEGLKSCYYSKTRKYPTATIGTIAQGKYRKQLIRDALIMTKMVDVDKTEINMPEFKNKKKVKLFKRRSSSLQNSIKDVCCFPQIRTQPQTPRYAFSRQASLTSRNADSSSISDRNGHSKAKRSISKRDTSESKYSIPTQEIEPIAEESPRQLSSSKFGFYKSKTMAPSLFKAERETSPNDSNMFRRTSRQKNSDEPIQRKGSPNFSKDDKFLSSPIVQKMTLGQTLSKPTTGYLEQLVGIIDCESSFSEAPKKRAKESLFSSIDRKEPMIRINMSRITKITKQQCSPRSPL